MKEKPVVSDSSVLICFANAEKLNLLKELMGRIIIPQAVYQEIGVKGKPRADKILGSD